MLHVNGSLNARGSRKDRHATVRAEGSVIPSIALRNLSQHSLLESVPKIIETFKTEETLVGDLTYLRTKSRFRRPG